MHGITDWLLRCVILYRHRSCINLSNRLTLSVFTFVYMWPNVFNAKSSSAEYMCAMYFKQTGAIGGRVFMTKCKSKPCVRIQDRNKKMQVWSVYCSWYKCSYYLPPTYNTVYKHCSSDISLPLLIEKVDFNFMFCFDASKDILSTVLTRKKNGQLESIIVAKFSLARYATYTLYHGSWYSTSESDVLWRQ